MTLPVTAGVDVVIFGGGAAGLWLLDELTEQGRSALLLEAFSLGSGQTIASQGIIHGGLKYTLGGLLTPSARAIRAMPTVWRRCLAGEESPDLRGTRVRAEFCYLWRTQSLKSRAAMIGARAGLRITPTPLESDARPGLLRDCPGPVARLDEQVIDPESLMTHLADRHQSRILRIDPAHGLEIQTSEPGVATLIRLINPDTGEPLDLQPAQVVLVAGAGNGDLRRRVGLDEHRIQLRPLHMVVMRGSLPLLNGHCVDGMHTRVTITSFLDFADRSTWQIGGQVAEDGVEMDRRKLIEHTRAELRDVLPGIDLSGTEWTTYRVDRAEARTRSGRRPADSSALREGNVITAWPTKLALVPHLTDQIRQLLPEEGAGPAALPDILRAWPRPDVAAPPWEEEPQWFHEV